MFFPKREWFITVNTPVGYKLFSG